MPQGERSVPLRGVPRGDTPLGDSLVTFVVKRKSPGAPSMARPCSRGAPAQGESRGATPLAYSGYAGALPLLQLPRGAAVPLHLYPETNKKLHPNVQPNRKKNKKRGGPPCLFGGEPLCMLRLTTHQHVPLNAICDPGKIIVPQLLKIAGKSVIITKLDCIH